MAQPSPNNSFYGRTRELGSLQLLTAKAVASLVTVTGRRRIGKSRLIQEFARGNPDYQFLTISGLAPAPGVRDQSQREEFARQLERGLSIPPVASGDWSDLFANLAYHTRKGKWIVLLDEISWLGNGVATFLPKLKNAWDLEFRNNPELILILCGSVSSWIERNLLSSTGFVGRVTSRLRLEELDIQACRGFWRDSHHSAYDQLKVLSVTGGVPRYLEEVIPSLSADQIIHRLCFQPDGLLLAEFDQIFSDLFGSNSANYRAVVGYLAAGPAAPKAICQAIGLPENGVSSRIFEDLASSGFVTRDFAWSLRSSTPSRLSRYRLSDNYLRFYLRFVLPEREAILAGRFVERPVTSLPGWDSIMGLQFENLVLRNRSLIWDACGIAASDVLHDGPYMQTKTKRQQGCQIDYLIQTRHGPLYLCEIKFRRRPIGMELCSEIDEKIRRLSVPSRCSVLPVLIHAGEVTEELQYSTQLARIVDFASVLKS